MFNNGAFGCANVPDQFDTGLVEPDGSIVAAGLTQRSCGSSGGAFLVVRYETPGGSASPFFSEIPDFHGGWDGVLSLVRQPDGKLVAAGHASGATRDAALARYEADGSLDTSFDGDGKHTVDVAGGSQDTPTGLALQPDGHIVVVGVTEYPDGSSDFALLRFVGDTGPLPVELTAFDAHVDGADVVLRWTTVSETINAGFEVQHRASEGWRPLAFVSGHGTTTEVQTYAHRVAGLAPGRHAFRLRQLDHDGTATYGPAVEVSVAVPGAYQLTAVYPNPFGTRARLALSVAAAQQVTATLHDALGRRVATLFEGTMPAGRAHMLTLASDDLADGLYLIRAHGETFTSTRRVVLVR